MAILEEQLRYVSETDLPNGAPQRCKIVRYYEEAGRNKIPDRTLHILINGMERRLVIWGDNVNKLIKRFGKDTDQWADKEFDLRIVHRDGKRMREII